ncbi:MAG: flagellar hook-associated protein FlgK [Clostridiales bacterium]|jgi:flagellar hook-associated protein 1 FlgK|nr:flagellar hook-associated protein FlgK [Clostridiales bacterium]
MSSTFYGFEVARTGLVASQYALNVTGHNISNADTVGYTRQRLLTTSKVPAVGFTQFALSECASVGGGVSVDAVNQIRDEFLDRQFRKENADAGYLDKLTAGLTDIETMFDELSSMSISKTLSEFFNSFQDLANNPTDYEVRAEVQSKAMQLTSTLNYYHGKLSDQQTVYDLSVDTLTGKVNEIAESIAHLNKTIEEYEITGETANDLRDQRNLLLDQLSGIVDITYYHTPSGQLYVQLGGRDLVSHTTVGALATAQTGYNPLTGLNELNEVIWESDSAAVTITSGSLKGTLQLRDGNIQDEYGIPYLVDSLNTLVNALVDEINAVHSQGWTLPCDENGGASITGVNFFDDFGGAVPVTAGNFKLDDAILLTPNNIAASDVEITAANHQEGNNLNAHAILAVINSSSLSGINNFQGYMTTIVSTLAIRVSYSKNMSDMQKVMLSNKEASRISISGVSIDEEVANMLKYQHAYNAAARVITTMDEALDMLINRMGIVGR